MVNKETPAGQEPGETKEAISRLFPSINNSKFRDAYITLIITLPLMLGAKGVAMALEAIEEAWVRSNLMEKHPDAVKDPVTGNVVCGEAKKDLSDEEMVEIKICGNTVAVRESVAEALKKVIEVEGVLEDSANPNDCFIKRGFLPNATHARTNRTDTCTRPPKPDCDHVALGGRGVLVVDHHADETLANHGFVPADRKDQQNIWWHHPLQGKK